MRTWHENVSLQQRKEDTVGTQFFTKMRLRILRQAFDMYRDTAKRMSQMIKNEARS